MTWRRTKRSAWWALAVAAILVSPLSAQRPLPPGAVTVVNEDRFGSQTALCVETGDKPVQRGARTISATEVWAGEASNLHRLNAGPGACDPAWSPDGRWLAVTDAAGLWIFGADSAEGTLHVEAKPPMGELTEFSYRAFSHPKWSADGDLVALLISNGGTSWVDVYQASTGKLFYTSPPENYSFSWGSSARELNLGDLQVIRLPQYR